ncbi:MAG: hypothetical protein R3Y47_09685 [Lachnospiraceae bacterium]
MKIIHDKKKLPISYPIITSYVTYADTLAILQNYKESEGWIYSNFINIWADTSNVGDKAFRFEGWQIHNMCPQLYVTTMERAVLNNVSIDICDFIKSAISLNYYVRLSYDSYYIRSSDKHKKSHYVHTMLLYSYDDSLNEFEGADFFVNGVYSFQKISYEEMKEAIISADHLTQYSYFTMIRYDKHRFNFNIEVVKHSIDNYLNSTNYRLAQQPQFLEHNEISAIEEGKMKFGLSYYNELIKILKTILENDADFYDIRPLHVLYDHKAMMNKRILYLIECHAYKLEEELVNSFIKIEKEVLSLRNLFLKYRITNNKKIVEKIIHELKCLRDEERSALEKLKEAL